MALRRGWSARGRVCDRRSHLLRRPRASDERDRLPEGPTHQVAAALFAVLERGAICFEQRPVGERPMHS